MAPIQLLVSGGGGSDGRRSIEGAALREIERRLSDRLEDVPRCDSSRGPSLQVCLFGKNTKNLSVSVVECCCHEHAEEARRRAERVLRLTGDQS